MCCRAIQGGAMFIGRYEVCGLLGRGGMGTVYKVRQPHTGRIAALKLLKPADIMLDLVGMDVLRERFLHEAMVMASCDHPNIAAVWDVDMAGSLPFFVMEYYCLNLGLLMGESYRVEAPTRRLPFERAVHYARQTLCALERMHHAGVIHRDVKPYNIMLTGDDTVKLIDFGLSRLRGELGRSPRGIKVGSPYYAPPEQENAPDEVDARADLYPVGVMLFRLLTGILPTSEEQMIDGRIPRASALSEDLDPAWDAFFDKAMSPVPHDRFAGASAMRTTLDTLEHSWRQRVEATCALLPETEALPGASARPEAEAIHGAAVRPERADALEVITRPQAEALRGADTPPDALERLQPAGLAAPASAPAPCTVVSHGLAETPRFWPVKVGVREARRVFQLDALWRPAMGRRDGLIACADGTVLHRHTGLQWEAGGGDYPLAWTEIAEHVAGRNSACFAGHDDWRLPTVAELLTLVDAPPVLEGHCVPSLFDDRMDPLWTADRKSYMAAWFVSASMGFVGWQDDTCRFGVRLVRSLRPERI